MTGLAESLHQRYGIAGVARVVAGNGGLPKVEVTTGAARGEIYLHGAQVTSWVPAGHAEVLFVSRASRWEAGKAIRGGIPICFPWFGNKADNAVAPAHGFARTADWTLESIAPDAGAVRVVMALESSDQTRVRWPHEFRAVLRVTFGASLDLELETTNNGSTPFTFEEALHTYFAVGDAATVRVAGLDGVRYLDKVGGGEQVQQGDITFSGETDRVYLDTAGAARIVDPAMRRRTDISKSHSQSTVVWNPWIDKARALADLADDEWTRMVCVETGNVGAAAVSLQPSRQHTLTLRVTLTAA